MKTKAECSMDFAERLRELRKQSDLTQAELAEEINMSENAVSMWERKERTPSHESLVKLADFFKVSTDYLSGLSDNKQDNKIKDNTQKQTTIHKGKTIEVVVKEEAKTIQEMLGLDYKFPF